jgi:hypothetical protein
VSSASVATTLRLYAHVTHASTEALVDAIDARYGPRMRVLSEEVLAQYWPSTSKRHEGAGSMWRCSPLGAGLGARITMPITPHQSTPATRVRSCVDRDHPWQQVGGGRAT